MSSFSVRLVSIACSLMLAVLVSACGGNGSTRCTAGDSQACSCTDGSSGAQTCETGGAWGACVCEEPADESAPSTSADPAGGIYDATQSVALVCTDAGSGCAATHYTVDGSEPTTDSPTYGSPLSIDASTTLHFFSVDADGNVEDIRTEVYVVDTLPPTTTATPAGGDYTDAVEVTLACVDAGPSGCDETYYTTDGSDPTTASMAYAGPITVSADTTLKFFSTDAAGNTEAFVTEVYGFDTTAPTTTAAPAGGLSTSAPSVTLACDDGAGSGCAATYYTLDGSDPTELSARYTAALVLTGSTTLKFYSVDLAGNAEAIVTETYQVDGDAPVTTASVSGGLYASTQTVALACDDGAGSGCAATYYTTDGTDPTTASAAYSAPLSVSADTTLKFFSTDTAGNAEAIVTQTYAIDGTAPTTTASPSGGLSTSGPPVTLTCDDGTGSGCAATYYTLDGTDPTSSSAQYTTTLILSASTTLKFYSVDLAGNAEAIVTVTYTVDGDVPTTTASVAGGLYASTQTVALTCDDGAGSGCAGTYYTTDGTDPTTASAAYSAPLSVTADTTLKFFSVDNAGNMEAIVTKTYAIDGAAPTTTAAPSGGLSTTAPTVTLSCDDGGGSGCAATYYTLDGNDPTSSSAQYTAALVLTGSTTLKFFSVDNAGNAEGITTETYEVDADAPLTVASVPGGVYASAQSVALACDDGSGSGCVATYFTTDGTDPTTASTVYSGPISVNADTTLKFFSADVLGNAEAIQSESYTIDSVGPATTASPAGGTYASTVMVSLSCTDGSSGCGLTYYTTDGTDPTTASPVYLAPFPVSATSTVKFFSTDIAGNPETIRTEVYTIDDLPPVTTASPGGGLYGVSVSVTLTCDDGGGSGCGAIHYTTDGSIPSTASAVFAAPIVLTADGLLRFFALDALGNAEPVQTEGYLVDTQAPITTPAPPAGIYAGAQSVTLACDDGSGVGCGNTYYTTDGSTPTTASPVYAGAISVATTSTLRFFSEDASGVAESVRSATYVIDDREPMSAASPVGGIFNSSQAVALGCDDNVGSGCAAIYYTTDGTVPTTASTVYVGAIAVNDDTVLRFLAEDIAGNLETFNEEIYVIDPDAPTTTASPAGGIFNAVQSVTLTCADAETGCDVTYYTTDGTDPTTSSAVYAGALSVAANTTLKFFSVDVAGNSEAIVTETYTIDLDDPLTTASPVGGTYNADQTVTLICADGAGTGCADTYYTTDGSDPTTASAAYAGAFTFTANTTLKFFSVDGAGNQEAIQTEVYEIDKAAPTTVAVPAGSLYNADQSVALNCNDGAGSGCATTYYTTDGTDPTTASPVYGGAIAITADTTLKFFSVDAAGNPETFVTEIYDLDKDAPTTTASPLGGLFNADQSVTLTCADADSGCANIYYTTDGSDPTTASPVYGGAIVLSATTDLKFFSTDVAGNEEAFQTETYVIDKVPPTVDVTDPTDGGFNFPLDGVIRIHFDEVMDAATITAANIEVNAGAITGVVAYDGTDWATFTPDADLLEDTVYTVSVSTGVTDEAGNAMAAPYSFDFRTMIPPIVVNDDGSSRFTPHGIAFDTVGNGLALWEIGTSTGTRVVYSAYDAVAGVWGAPVDLYDLDSPAPPRVPSTSDQEFVGTTRVASNGTDFMMVYQIASPPYHAAAVYRPGLGLEPPMGFKASTQSPEHVDVASNGSGFAVTWREFGGFRDVRANVYDSATGLWEGEALLEATAGNADYPKIASNGSGYAVVWRQGGHRANVWTPLGGWEGESELDTAFGGFATVTALGADYFAAWGVADETVVSAHAGGGPWSAPIRVDTISGGSSDFWHSLSSDGTTVMLSFLQRDGAGVDGAWSTFYDAGTGWDVVETRIEDERASINRIHGGSIGGGDFAVVWSDRDSASSADPLSLWETTYDDSTGTWSATGVLDPTIFNVSGYVHFRAAGTMSASWAQNAPVGPTLNVRTNAGAGWSANERIVSGGFPSSAFGPRLAANDAGEIVAVWGQLQFDNFVVYGAFYNGFVWSVPTQLSSTTTPARDPVVASDGTDFMAAYAQQGDGIVTREYSGGTWGAPVIAGPALPYLAEPEIASNGTGYALAFEDRDGSADSIWAAVHDGSSWGAPQTLEANSRPARTPRITSNGSGYGVVWFQEDAIGADSPVGTTYYFDTFAGDWVWDAPTELDALFLDSYYAPAIASNGSGYAAVWVQRDGGSIYAHSNFHDGSAWGGPERFDTVGGSAVGEPGLGSNGSGYLAVWQTSGTALWASVHDGSTWGAQVDIGRGTQADPPVVASDGTGYRVVNKEVNAVMLHTWDGSTWLTPEVIDLEAASPYNQTIISSPSGYVAAWSQTVDGENRTIRRLLVRRGL